MAEFRVVLQCNALQRMITVDGKTQTISEAYWNANIQNKLYPFWTTDNDRLIHFNYFDNGSYGCERKKYVYDRVTTNKKWTTYEWKEPSEAQALDIANELKAKYFEYQDVEQEEIQEELYQQYGKWNKVSWEGIKMIRNFLLDDSDWTQMPDTALDTATKAMWTAYRTKLRAIPQDYNGQEADDVKFPINPTFYTTRFKDIEVTAEEDGVMVTKKPNEAKAYLDTADQFGKFPDNSLNTWSRRITTQIANAYKIKNPDDVFPQSDISQKFANTQEELDALLKAFQDNNV